MGNFENKTELFGTLGLSINRFNFKSLCIDDWYFSVERALFGFFFNMNCFLWIFKCLSRASFCTHKHVCIFQWSYLKKKKSHARAHTQLHLVQWLYIHMNACSVFISECMHFNKSRCRVRVGCERAVRKYTCWCICSERALQLDCTSQVGVCSLQLPCNPAGFKQYC